jgi:hypothetical protein
LPAFFTSIKTTNRNGSPGADGGYRATAFGSDCVTLFPQMIALHGQAGELGFLVGNSVVQTAAGPDGQQVRSQSGKAKGSASRD